MCLDETVEAKKAVDSYIFHWEKHCTLLLDIRKKEAIEKVKKASPRGKDAVLPRFKSHRISGNITQFPDTPTFNMGFEAETENPDNNLLGADMRQMSPKSPSFRQRALSYSRPSTSTRTETEDDVYMGVVIERVDGESVADVVGVLITGMRLLLWKHEGNIELVFLYSPSNPLSLIVATSRQIW